MRLLIVILVFSMSTLAHAALPPQYQRIEEMERILRDQGVGRALQSKPIDGIERVGNDRFRVTAGACHVDVEIVSKDAPEGMPGPRQFDVLTHSPVCS